MVRTDAFDQVKQERRKRSKPPNEQTPKECQPAFAFRFLLFFKDTYSLVLNVRGFQPAGEHRRSGDFAADVLGFERFQLRAKEIDSMVRQLKKVQQVRI